MIHTERRIEALLAVAEFHLATNGLIPTDVEAQLIAEGIDPTHLYETEDGTEAEA